MVRLMKKFNTCSLLEAVNIDILLALITSIMAIIIATAQLVSIKLVAFIGALWISITIVLFLPRLWSLYRDKSACSILFIFAVTLAIARISSLGIIQLVNNNEYLYWNDDWRHAASHSQTIARFSGLNDSIDFSSTPLNYHVGPAWIAGALHGLFDVPINIVLFTLIPLSCMFIICVMSYRFLRLMGFSSAASLISASVMVNVSPEPLMLLYQISKVGLVKFLDPAICLFQPGLMLNSLLALAVGMSSTVIIFGSYNIILSFIGCVSMASIVVMKPQYCVAFLVTVLPAYLFQNYQMSQLKQVAIKFFIIAFFFGLFYLFSKKPLVIKLTDYRFLGASIQNLFYPFDLLRISVFGIFFMVPIMFQSRKFDNKLIYSLVAISLGSLLSVLFLETTIFNVSKDDISNARSIGLEFNQLSFHRDLQQAYRPLMLVCGLNFIAAFLEFIFLYLKILYKLVLLPATICVFSSLPYTVSAALYPRGQSAYEWTDESDLGSLLKLVRNKRNGLWISSDIADAAQNYLRSLEGHSITSLSDAQFYVVNAFSYFYSRSSYDRLMELNKFYFEDWSSWHDKFLHEKNIKYILVHDRCPPKWNIENIGHFNVLRIGSWMLFSSEKFENEVSATNFEFRKYDGFPVYGLSKCLWGGQAIK